MSAPRTFLVEAYVPARSDFGPVLEQARLVAAPNGPGDPIRHVRSILLPDDETCFHLYEAASIDALSSAITATDIRANRIVEVTT
jgi:hypothetical protein